MVLPLRKLCIVNPYHQGGGAEYQISCLIDVLAATGRYEIHYLARHVNAHIKPGHYRVVQIGADGQLPKLGYIVDAMPLYRALACIQPDVIYQRVAGAYTGICAWYARRNRVSMVWHVAHDSDVNRDRSFYGRNFVRAFLEKRSVEYAIRAANRIVTQTISQSDLLSASYGRRADVIIPNFQPAPQERIDKSGSLKVLWIANLKPIKQPDAFVRLAKALHDLANVHFVIIGPFTVGTGDGNWGEELMQAIRETSNVEYRGPLSQDGVNRELASAHVFVNTSVQEGFPNTFIQAWMREVPVVSLNVDPDKVLDREQIGMFAGTEEKLADAVRTYVCDHERRSGDAQRARQYAMAHHSLRNADRLERLLAEDL